MALFGRGRSARSLERLIGDFELPHFPVTTLKALEVLRDEDATPEQIADALGVDPGLTVRVLRLVNSAAFGLRQEIEHVPHAVRLVGRSALESLLICEGVRSTLPSPSVAGFDPGAFWRGAARRASVARALARRFEPAQAVALFTAALLQDMAVPLLVERKGADYAALIESAAQDGVALAELEREAFGWDHGEVGRAMCEKWGLPAHLGEAIAGHHAARADEGAAPAPVRIAALLPDTPADEKSEEDEAEALAPLLACAAEEFETDEGPLQALVSEALAEAESLAAMLG